MTIVYAVLAFVGMLPFWLAEQSNRSTSLRHTVYWGMAAWFTWAWALVEADARQTGLEPVRYVALCLTGAAGVAVLGARRPYVFAWNFVVLGLLAVMLLPLIESLAIGTDPVDPLRITFLSATLFVGLLNYLPTRSLPAVLLMGAALLGEMLAMFAPETLPDATLVQLFHLLLLLTPWAVWGCWRGQWSRMEFDCLWLDFRDRLGLFWSQRIREQFNRAADNAGWPVHLSWRGLHRTNAREAIAPAEQQAMLDTLRKALQRFTVPPAG
jgi:hypothetical protein